MTIKQAYEAALNAVLNYLIGQAEVPQPQVLDEEHPDNQIQVRRVGDIIQQVKAEQHARLLKMTVEEVFALVELLDTNTNNRGQA